MRFTRTLLLVSLVALVAVPAAFAIRFGDADFNLPLGQTGKAYSFQLVVSDGSAHDKDTVTVTVRAPSPVFRDDFEQDRGWRVNPTGTDRANASQSRCST